VIGSHSGEGIFDMFDQAIGQTIDYFRPQGLLNEQPLSFKLEKYAAPPSLLSFPARYSPMRRPVDSSLPIRTTIGSSSPDSMGRYRR
jgi:hypothetical protein